MADKHSAPAFSMGNSKFNNKSPTQSYPGPGSYQASSSINSKVSNNVKSSQPRFRQYSNFIPGPGTYNSPQVKQHVPTALILSRTKEEKLPIVPGPGAYQPNYLKIIKSESGFTIGGSSKIGDIVGQAKKLPGPGNYEINKSTVTKDHAFKIGTEKRSQMILNNFTPGPGQYKQVKPEEVMKSMPKTIFGKSGRSLSSSNIGPGPGTYKIPDKFNESINKSKGFSMSSKHNEKPFLPPNNPGPGSQQDVIQFSNTQELDKLKHKIVAFSVGKQARLKIQNQKEILSHPGPQKYSYKLTTFDSNSNIFGKQKRPTLANQTTIPGPGAYHAKVQSDLPQFSIPKSNSGTFKAKNTPGPGSYDPKINDSSQYNSIKLAKDERKPFYNEKKGIPGPGSYDQKPIQKSIGYVMGNEKRGQVKDHKVPGPGNYNISSTISNLPKYSR